MRAAACWDDWAAAMGRRGLSGGTVAKRRSELRSWSAFVGKRWKRAQRADVERWLDSRTLGARARYSAVSHLHAFYLWARREGLVDVDPTELVERPRLPRRLPRPARRSAVVRAVGEARDPVEVACALMAWAGLRCCEVSRLDWDDVDQVAGVLYVSGKGGRDRVVPIGRPLAPILAQHDGASGPVMGRRCTPARVSQVVNEHLRRRAAGCTAHQLRHHAATAVLGVSGDVAAVQVFLGHASLQTTQVYAQVDPAAVRRAVSLL